MQTNKQKVDSAIKKLSVESGQLPEVSEIEKHTGLSAINVIRNLEYDYPKELLITLIERTVLDAFSETNNIRVISEKLNLPYRDVSNAIQRLKQKGLIERKEKKIKEDFVPTKKNTTYVEITEDVFVETAKKKINIKGGRGYFDKSSKIKENYVIFFEKIAYHVSLTNKQYREY